MPRLCSSIAASVLCLAAVACDDKPPANERKSVIEGGKAESAPGKQLERAKQDIEGAERQLQERADDQFDKSAPEQVERGVP